MPQSYVACFSLRYLFRKLQAGLWCRTRVSVPVNNFKITRRILLKRSMNTMSPEATQTLYFLISCYN
jgi:hypothetical protein